MRPQLKDYSYTEAGFDGFMQRSIEGLYENLDANATGGGTGMSSRSLNFDQMAVGGKLGDKLVIGSITIDGTQGRISVHDSNNAEVVRIGSL